jgi:hypothetical protein
MVKTCSLCHEPMRATSKLDMHYRCFGRLRGQKRKALNLRIIKELGRSKPAQLEDPGLDGTPYLRAWRALKASNDSYEVLAEYTGLSAEYLQFVQEVSGMRPEERGK